MKATKKPVTIDYIPYTGDIHTIMVWVERELKDNFFNWFDIKEFDNEQSLYVLTLEGTSYEVTTDDMILRGTEGEYYPCKKTIFAKTYDVCQE